MHKTLYAIMAIASCAAVAVAQDRYKFPAEVKPLVKTEWAQDHPFNKLCPWESKDSTVVHAYAGCGPLVMSQVMKRYDYPPTNKSTGSAYDWAQMFLKLTDSVTTAEEDAVARLIIDCGTAANTVYGQSASSTKLNDLVTGLKKDFGYSPYMSIADRAYYKGEVGDRAWKNLMYKELKGGRPIIMRGERNAHFAHVFIIDGCRDSTVHVNFGWGGKRNGYYDPDSLYGFTRNHRMIVGAAPATATNTPNIRRITVGSPGRLAQQITEADWIETRHIKVSGPIGRADVALLRQMAGGARRGERNGNLATIDLSNAVILALPDSAFHGCDNLTYITLPQTLPEVSACCFANCPKLNRVDFSRSVVSVIRPRAFYACFCLAEVNMSQTLRVVGDNAFNSCNSIVDVTLPQSVTTVGHGAFAFAKQLRRLVVPRTATSIGADVIKGTVATKITRL